MAQSNTDVDRPICNASKVLLKPWHQRSRQQSHHRLTAARITLPWRWCPSWKCGLEVTEDSFISSSLLKLHSQAATVTGTAFLHEIHKDFSSNLCVLTGSGAHPASFTMGTGGKAPPGRDADHSPPSSAEVENEELYLLSAPRASVACGVTALAFTFTKFPSTRFIGDPHTQC
jgi:hypothetical protein